ncbi:MAG: acetyl-CoA carboxylase biotin carboxyl carrier protein [Planctomycetota bacterium]
MDIRELKRIVTLMNENDLVEFELEEDGRKLKLKKGGAFVPAMVPAPATAAAAPGAPPPAAAEPATADAGAAAPAAPDDGLHVITAPMVGTYYVAPAPDADPYAEVGDKVTPDSVVCILEAMKVMNEIKADCRGEIVTMCVKNGEAVEYGQALFKVRLS